MSEIRTQQCDGESCKMVRMNDTNRWLAAWLKHGILHMTLMENTHCPDDTEVKHFCGEQCATKWVLKETSELRLAK